MEEELRLGKMPGDLIEMLKRFNGGRLFGDTVPLFNIFGLSLPSSRADLDWFIDRYTPAWRRSAMGQPTDWVIGITNYGGLMILGDDLHVSEWDKSQSEWINDRHPFEVWVERVMEEGAAYLAED